jgi:murein DD-endopeptidase MepM/ murein hydrolase activator NlpD
MPATVPDPPSRRRLVPAASLGLLAVLALAALAAAPRPGLPPPPAAVAPPEPASPPAPPERLRSLALRVGPNRAPAQVLAALDLGPGEVREVLAALQDHVPFRRIRPDDQVRLERDEASGALRSLSWRQGPADEILVRPCGESLCADRRAVDLTTERVRVSATVRSSVYEAVRDAGEDPGLAVAAADVLAWDVDFYQDVRAGDSLRVVVEKVHADGRFLRHGEVLAIEYEGASAGRKRLFRYTDPSGRSSYFDDAGQSARRGFLRAPVPYVHLTSRFGSRRHPTLQYVRAHRGVDYGAPEGTPVWAVGDGLVTQAGWNGDCGRSLTIRHRNGFETVYCHLSRVEVQAGARVAQKQVVGSVGRTGLATGPHLHFAVRQGGAFVNPLRLQLPRGEPVPPAWRADFEAQIGPLREQLDRSPLALRGLAPAG